MPETKQQQHSWIAGLKEQRIALAIAAAASLAMIVLLILAPDMAADSKGSAKKSQPTANTPVYAIPERHAAQPPKQHIKTPPPPHKKHTKDTSKQKTAPKKKVPHKIKPVSNVAPKNHPKPIKSTQHAVFFVQVAAYREKNSAQQQAASLMQKGWNSMVTRNNKGLYVVRIGPVSDRPAAIVLHRKLIDKAQLKGFIVQGG